jgi:hypothetical protein
VARTASFPLASDQVVCATADPARDVFQTALCDLIVDCPQRVGETFPVTAWSSRVHDPTPRLVLNEEGMERNKVLREGERVPTAVEIDLDRGRGVALGEADARTQMLAHLRLLSFACFDAVFA